MKRSETIIIGVFYFVFLALFFPGLQDASLDAVSAGNFTGAQASIIGNLPLLFMVASVIFFIYAILRGRG